ncbi:MAG: alkyl sulfatase dimerization domain-containing protein [Pseudomonadales bacterium]
MRTPLYKSRPYGPSSARFGGERINDFIVMSEGCSNTYLIETSEGSILINTGMGYEAPVHLKNYQDLSPVSDNIRYVITTQGHVDHTGGVQYFRDLNPGLQYIAQANNEEHQSYDERLRDFRANRSAFRFMDAFVEDFGYYAEQGYTDINAQDRPTADLTFEDRYEFTLGGLEVVLIGVKGAETNDSLVVWLPQHGICLTGNLFGCPFGHFPNLVTIRGDRYRDALVCAAAAQTVLDLDAELILYGHHAPIEGKELIKTEVTAFRDAILYVHDETVKGMNEGKTLHTLMQEIQLPAKCEVGQGYGKVSWSIRAIWENYAGWFHHDSTTELYSVPQSSVHADLIELAGVDALVQRAQQKFDAGHSEEAQHLLDIIFTEQPACEGAVRLSIAIHEKLLSEADNFWLNGWLENQIKLLKGGQTEALSFK